MRIKIPKNYATDSFMVGNFKLRNVIEAVLIALIILVPTWLILPFSIQTRIVVSIILGGIPTLFALLGINGLPLSEYVIIFFDFMNNKRVLTYPDSEAKIQRQKNLMQAKKKQAEMERELIELKKKEELEEKRNKKREERKAKINKFRKGKKNVSEAEEK